MIKNIFKAIGCLSLVIAAVNTGMAQENQTPASVAKQKMNNIWIFNTNNAAAGVVDNPNHYSITDLGYNSANGDFKMVQDGEKNNTLRFHTEGGGVYTNLNNMFLWGDFTYNRKELNDVRFNASMYDPFRDMPFFLGDSTASKWVNQDYTISMKAAFPKLFNFLTLGASGSYMAAQGAKQIDPRPLIRVSKFDIGASIVMEFGKNHFVGFNYDYFSRREDMYIGNTNNRVVPMIWEYLAPGFFSQAAFDYYSAVIPTRYYNANAMGGGMQYGFKNDNWNILLAANYMQKVEDVDSEYLDDDAGPENGKTPLKMIGTVKEDTWEGKLIANYTLDNGNLISLRGNYTDKSVDGIEYFQTFDNTYEVQKWIINAKYTRSNFSKVNTTINLDYMVNDGNVYTWWAGVEYANKTNDWIYYLPTSTQNVKNSIYTAFVSRHIKMKDNHSLTLNVHGGFSANNEAELIYKGVQGDNLGWTMLTVKDFAFLTSDYTKVGGEVSYSFSGFKNSSMSMFATINFDYYSPDSNQFDKRTVTNFKIGLAF